MPGEEEAEEEEEEEEQEEEVANAEAESHESRTRSCGCLSQLDLWTDVTDGLTDCACRTMSYWYGSTRRKKNGSLAVLGGYPRV